MALRIPPAMGIATSAGRARVLANRFIILMDLAVTDLCLKAPIKPALQPGMRGTMDRGEGEDTGCRRPGGGLQV